PSLLLLVLSEYSFFFDFFFSSRRRHTRFSRDWSSDVCSSDLTADGVSDPDRRDDLEARALYELIEDRVAPLFYDADGEGLPKRWLEMVKHTLVSLGPKVLATRMVQDYVAGYYRGAAASSRALLDGGAAGAREDRKSVV